MERRRPPLEIHIAEITPRINRQRVCMTGRLIDRPKRLSRGGYFCLVDDGTGTLLVFLSESKEFRIREEEHVRFMGLLRANLNQVAWLEAEGAAPAMPDVRDR